jgi:1-acyl-sn-glycerol-3-phosphate acyltransferase
VNPVKLFQFLSKRKALLFIVSFALASFFVFIGSKNKVEEDLTRFIPKDEASKKINFVLENLKVKDKIILTLFCNDSTQNDADLIQSAADSLAQKLLPYQHKGVIENFTHKIADDQMAGIYAFFYRHLPLYLEAEDYQFLYRNLNNDSVKNILENNYKTLLSPSSIALAKYIRKDPFSLTPRTLKKLQNLQFDENFSVNNGYVMTQNERYLLMFVTPATKTNEGRKNQEFIEELDQICSNIENEFNDKIKVQYYGAPVVASGNAIQMKKDSVITSGIALTLIALMLILFFRRITVIIYILLPVAFGGAFSLAACYLLKGEISAIALGGGAVILGIAINYSLHFFTHYKHEPDPEKVVSDLSFPMLIGCATTVAAFFSLQFAKSQALHDFGMFAGFALIGAALFSVIVLPHLLGNKKVKNDNDNHEGKIEKWVAYPFHKNKFLILSTLILTIIFAYTGRHVNFESDMMKINYQNEKLEEAQKNLDRINQFSLRSVYVVAQDSSMEKALRKNEKILYRLNHLKSNASVTKFSSISQLILSDSLQQIKIDQWNNFIDKNKNIIQNLLITNGKSFKFKDEAFAEFYHYLDVPQTKISKGWKDSLAFLQGDEWISEKNGTVSVFNLVKTNAEKKDLIYSAFDKQNGITVFDRQYLSTQFVEMISSDFNTILLITALIVFGFMLLTHGRFELAFINFLPMLISWVWILGIMGLAGLKFNIINIIISTFIFGLGDDYSIFIMDGLTHEYKYKKKNLDSYKASILLSVLTTIFGMGALIFAKHPALYSIASITIIGMITVLFISFIVQPLLYNYWILNRTRRGLVPFTLFNYLLTTWGIIVFFTGSIIVNILSLSIYYLLPLKKDIRKAIIHKIVQVTMKGIVYMFINIRKDFEGWNENMNFSKPSIIISNHQSHIDLALTLMLNPKIIVFTNDWVYNNFFYGRIVKLADYQPASKGYEVAIDKVKDAMNKGYSVLIFPEGTRSDTAEILRFHKGAFYLAEKLQTDITPMLIHGANDCLQKNDFHFKNGQVTLKFLPRIKYDDSSFGNTYQEKSKSVRKYMALEFEKLRSRKENVHYYRPKLIRNYIFKGPVLEWYCRIKVGLEKNYELFESLLPKKGKIVDVGCGYGFLPLMLSFTGKEREVLGVDYDEEKIAVAQGAVSKSDKVNFEQGDVTKYSFSNADAFVISDVLHYLKEEQQKELIRRCADKLNVGGTLLIRDADKDKSNRHMGTRYTEFFSTNSGFNKTSGQGLHFVSAELIRTTLNEFPALKVEVIDNTKLTSNIIFVARKQKIS